MIGEKNMNDLSDNIMLMIGDDGMATLYDDTYDITIHCESKEEQDKVKRLLKNVPQWIPVTEDTLPEDNRVVVVCGDKGTWDFGTYRGHGDNIHFWHWKKNTYKHVYWWMYKKDALPEPFKEVTE